jgi:pyruvate,orthophosphate dikinase
MKPISSRALEVNIADYRVDVVIDPKYHVIQDVMSKYEGLQKALKAFLEEICHPRKNYQFIVKEARTFSLGYFYDLKTHPRGAEAVKLYVDIAIEALENSGNSEVRNDAFSNLYLLLQKFIRDSDEKMDDFLPVINYGFKQLSELTTDSFSLIARSYYQINRLARDVAINIPADRDFTAVNGLLAKYYECTFSYWLSERDPRQWFENEIPGSVSQEVSDLFVPLSHDQLRKRQKELRAVSESRSFKSLQALEELVTLPGYGDITGTYNTLPDKIFNAVTDEKLRHQYKLIVLFHTMNISGLSGLHEDTLRDINRDISWIIENEDIDHIQHLIETTFNILNRSIKKYPSTVLKSILNMGQGIYRTDESDLVHFFNEEVVKLGFQAPEFSGISDDWQIKGNLAHIENIRTWMELIKLNPKWSKKLLSSLIINLTLSGVLIKDTDLFPRNITGFLNADIKPVYNLVKQLMRLFPAYFNEIGAEGQLRDISTRIDEISGRKDRLIHFLRKQSHVESSNKIISLMEAILEFWKTGSKDGLKPYLPKNIFDEVETEGQYFDGVNKIINHIFDSRELKKMSEVLNLGEDYISGLFTEFSDEYRQDIERVALAITLYRLLSHKYCISYREIDEYIAQVESSIPHKMNDLRDALSIKDPYRKIARLLEILSELRDIILSEQEFPTQEDIYRKRHIAADIPSMYGSYKEAKFDALGLTFRLESLVNTLFEELTEEIDLHFITHDTFSRIYKYLQLFNEALILDGILSKEFEQQLDLMKRSLKIKLFTFSQYIDIFRGFTQAVRNIVSDYFDNIHKQNLGEISHQLSEDKLLPRFFYDSESREELVQKVSEGFLRDAIASSLGLQRLDLFLMRISNTLHEQADKLPVEKHYLLLTYNPRNVVTSISEPNSNLFDIVHLGNKALNIIRMKGLGLQVPPGFVVTTEVFRCRELIDSYVPARENFREKINREISALEKITGRHFGSPGNPLVVSVRSGAAVSQPGMMDSYLNVGMNEEIVRGLISETGKEWFAWDCYRRFLQSYGMSFGIPRDDFDAVIALFKKRYGVPLKKELSPEQMQDVTLAYKNLIESRGIKVEESPEEQLYIAIQRVLNSWNSEKAHTYRKIIGISDDWGTAVTVQKMIFGNLSEQSGSGVLFTHSPKYSADLLRPWGDYTIGNQGEDVVSGLVTTYPVSLFQARMENRPEEDALELKFPELFSALRETAKLLVYKKGWAPQDIEFTFEGPGRKDLFILQTRNMEMRERKGFSSFESAQEMTEKFLGHGIGVSGGALSGRAVFCFDDIERWRKDEPDTPLILVRGDTVPDDIKEISAAEGLLTARGGATSHAAIVANRLEKICVVGCRDLICLEKERKFVLNDKTVNAGEFISIDGSEGSIYFGRMKLAERRRE